MKTYADPKHCFFDLFQLQDTIIYIEKPFKQIILNTYR